MESIGGDLHQMQRTPLAPAHVEALRRAGAVTHYPAGTFLTRPGQPVDRFVYVEEGEIEVVNPYTDERHLPSTMGPTQFMGEISLLNGGNWSMAMRAVRDTRVLEVPRETVLALMSQIPEMSDIIITVFSARRRGAPVPTESPAKDQVQRRIRKFGRPIATSDILFGVLA